MNLDLLNLILIPDDILNLIWKYVKPSIKYSINKYYLNKFYCNRLSYINNKKYKYNKYLINYNKYIITNYNYLKYLIKNDITIFLKNIINAKLNEENLKKKYNILNKQIYFENKNFINIIDFSLYYAKNFQAQHTYNFIKELIKKYKLTMLEKKKHKNNNKLNNNNNKLIKWII